jgi:hypothetical protein
MFTDDIRITAGLRARRTLLSIWIAATVLLACVAMTAGVLSSGHAASLLASRVDASLDRPISKS